VIMYVWYATSVCTTDTIVWLAAYFICYRALQSYGTHRLAVGATADNINESALGRAVLRGV